MKLSKIISVFIAFVALFSSVANLDFKIPYVVYKDISYSTEDVNKLDIYVPQTAFKQKSNGIVLCLHGGSWYKGDKASMKKYCVNLAQNGIIAASMNYTLMTNDSLFSDYSLKKLLNEVILATKEIKKFSKAYDLNIRSLATLGYSAGGRISMMFAYTKADKSAIPLKFTANLAGPVDFRKENWSEKHSAVAAILNGYFWKADSLKNERDEREFINRSIKAVSPIDHIKKSNVPSLFAYAKKDTTVPYKQATILKNKLDKVGAPYSMIIFPNSDHKLADDSDKTDEFYQKLFKYCDKYF